jgi:hypothetical protein
MVPPGHRFFKKPCGSFRHPARQPRTGGPSFPDGSGGSCREGAVFSAWQRVKPHPEGAGVIVPAGGLFPPEKDTQPETTRDRIMMPAHTAGKDIFIENTSGQTVSMGIFMGFGRSRNLKHRCRKMRAVRHSLPLFARSGGFMSGRPVSGTGCTALTDFAGPVSPGISSDDGRNRISPVQSKSFLAGTGNYP